MHGSEISFFPLLIVIALSFLVPVALSPIRRFGIPVIVGEIVAGMVVGKSGFNLIEGSFVLEVLSVFGFAYLMFLSGLEIDFSGITSRRTGLRAGGWLARARTNPLAIGAMMFVVTGLGSVAAGFYLQHAGLADNPWIMALILSTTSLGVVAPVLKERDLIEGRWGQSILAAALLADFVTILLISAYVVLRGQGLSFDLLLILVLLMAFLGVYRLAARFRENLPAQRLMAGLSTATAQIRVRGSLALALVFIALAESLGIENILGAFLAGVIVSLLAGRESPMLREKLDAIGYGFFIPIFFVMVGVGFDLPALMDSGSALELVGLLLAIAFGIKLVAGLVFRLAFSWRETIAASALLSARLSLIIAAATIGVEIGAITPAMEAAIILVAIITCLVSPVAFMWLAPDTSESHGDRIMVIGSEREANALVRRLQRLECDAVAVTDLPTTGPEGETPPRSVFAQPLRNAGIQTATTVVAMLDSDQANLQICRLARDIHAVRNVVAWVRDPALNPRFREARARVVNPSNSKLMILEGMALHAESFHATNDATDGQEVRVVKLQNRWLHDRSLRELGLLDRVSVLRLERRGAVIEPDLDTIVRANDTFTLAGEAGDVDDAARQFARRW